MLEFKTLLSFSKDVVSCMAHYYRDSWQAPPDNLRSPFTPSMGEAIIRFSLYYREWLDHAAHEVVYRVEKNPYDFFQFGYDIADQLYENEPLLELIGICSFVTYVAHVFFIMGKKEFMDRAYFMIAILFLKLRNRFEANGSWENFRRTCRKLIKDVKKEGKKAQQKLPHESTRESEIYMKSTNDIPNACKTSEKLTVTRSKSADPLENFNAAFRESSGAVTELTVESSKSEKIQKSTRDATKSTGAIPKSTASNKKSVSFVQNALRTGAIPKSTAANKKSAGVAQKSTGAIPKSTGAIPKSTGAIPKSTGAIPKSTGAIPKSTGAIPKSTGAIQKSTGIIQKSTSSAPKPTTRTPKSVGSDPKSTVTPKSTEITPKSTGAIPKSTGAISKSIGAIPKSTEVIKKSTDNSETETAAETTPKSPDGKMPQKKKSRKKKSKARRFKVPEHSIEEPGLVLVSARIINPEPKKDPQKPTERNVGSQSRNDGSPGPSNSTQ